MRTAAALAALALGGCSMIPGQVSFPPQAATPLAAMAAALPEAPQVTGAIYQAATYRPFFEDSRARRAGDMLTINLVEKTSASRKASSSAKRDGSASAAITDITRLPLKGLAGLKFEGESASKFEGKGETASDILLSGTLTVTVQRVLPNGYFLVGGEKQIGVNANVERLRFSGVVDPTTILAGNVVNSNQVADARIELSGAGSLSEAQRMGWLQRLFLSFWPI